VNLPEYDLYDQIDSFSTRLTMNTMNFLMKRGEILRIPEGTTVVTEGEESEHVFIIIEGDANVRKTDEQGNQVTIAVLGAGHLVGEMGVFLGHKRSATIVAKTAMNVVKFTNKDFINALPKTPDLTLKLLKSLSDKVHVVNGRLAEMAIASTMLILGLFVLERAKPGETCEISLDVTEVVRETRLEQNKIVSALRSLHKRNLITKLNLVNGHTLVFEAKIPALKTYLKRLGANS
jgi:CRP-like cAMP-binding protein